LIEKQWAVKAMHHAETYFSLLEAMDGSKLKLTKYGSSNGYTVEAPGDS
jgi:hypothetical protein